MIHTCRGDTRRFPYDELYELGRQLVRWVVDNRVKTASAVLADLEEVLRATGPADESEEFARELLEGTLAEFNDRKTRDSGSANNAMDTLRRLMGDETKLVWLTLSSA
jgi:hypothetical protein